MIANQPHAERNARLHCVANRRGHAGVRHRYNQIRVHRMLARQLPPQRFAAVIHAASENRAVRPREVHMLKNAELVRLFRREMDRLQSRLRNAQHLAWLDFAHILRVQQIESARFAGYDPGHFAIWRGEFSEIQRTEPAGIAHRVQFIRCEHHQRICAFALVQRVAQSAGQIARLRLCQQMHKNFGVAIGLKNGPAMLQLAPPFRGVRQIAVVADGNFALVAVDHDRLRIEQRFVARGRIPRVPDRRATRQRVQNFRRKNLFHFAHRAIREKFFAIRGNDSRRFLPAMLQRVQTQIHQLRGLFVAVHSDHAAIIVEVIVGVCEFLRHLDCMVRSSELAQPSRKSSMGESITARPLYSMRSAAFWVTWPASLAATPYCRAIA